MGFGLALIAMFSTLAIVFRSYGQPILVMAAIPFGMVGAVWGHVAMGWFLWDSVSLSLMSMMGIIALSGVVVNDSLILIVAINRYREDGMSLWEAVIAGSARRFRPILLTSLTTLITVVMLLVFGGGAINDFALALCIGVLVGTYSSIYVASPVLLALHGKSFREGKAAT